MTKTNFVLSLFIGLIGFTAIAQKNEWHNPFPQNELNSIYTTTYKTDSSGENNYVFEIKKNKINVLFDWKGDKAPFALLRTTKKYSSFNLELEYKWGERKFAPRSEQKRDAGILFHINGDIVIWPSSLECQIQENDTGDLWVIKGPKVSVINPDNSETLVDSSGEKEYMRGVKFANNENKGWNKVRLEVRSNKSAKFYVNGKLVNEIVNFLDSDGNPLNSGFIGIQAEGAELTYRNIKIQEI